MVPLILQPIILFVAITAAAIALVAAVLARLLLFILADLLCKISHVFLHGFHVRHE